MQLVNDEEPATIAVVIDKDKNASQSALKWALDNLVIRGQTITLVYVNIPGQPCDANTVFLPFRCFCTRKDVKCNDVVLQDNDMVKAIIDFVSETTVEKLVVGAPSSKGGFVWRMKSSDYTASISKGAPDFCSVYTISKGKVSSLRNATRAAPTVATHLKHQMAQVKPPSSIKHDNNGINRFQPRAGLPPLDNSCSPRSSTDRDTFRSPFARGGGRGNNSKFGDFPLLPETDISFVGGRPSNDFLNSTNSFYNQRLSCPESFDHSFDMSQPSLTSYNNSFAPSPSHYNNGSGNNNGYSSSSNSHGSSSVDDVEAEMKRLRLELKQTMDMYSSACKEAITAKQKAMELNQYKKAEDDAAAGTTDMEKARIRAAKEAAEASKRIAELEAQKRISAEKMSMSSRSSSSMESQGKNSMMSGSGGGGSTDIRYRRYTIEEIETATDIFSEEKKIGEGGYGPVYRGYLDHTPVAIKVLRPDAAQGRSQFNQEIEILSCIRHPNMVLLLGACPEYGCLVYEYMANGSLEDRLFRKGNTPPISWQQRFRIAAEIGTGLLFLHQTKPEPLVHRDLKPANILLDRNYGSKIADVGLARLVPPTVADSVTQYLMTSTAGTFCYIDPEYQQTGMLGVKSDIYSLGIMLLQIITAKPPMGLTHHVERAIDKGTFEEILDPAVPDWPVPEALALAKVAIKCAELRKKDRPDLNTYIIPTLNKLRDIADNDLMSRQQQLYPHPAFAINHGTTPRQSQVSMEDSISNPLTRHSGYESRSSGSS